MRKTLVESIMMIERQMKIPTVARPLRLHHKPSTKGPVTDTPRRTYRDEKGRGKSGMNLLGSAAPSL